jgi:DNA-binding CsgD family transcriptional regulator
VQNGLIRVVLAEDGVLAREGIVRIVASAEDIPVAFEPSDPQAPVVSDGERLRGVLVNVLTNAQHAHLHDEGIQSPPSLNVASGHGRPRVEPAADPVYAMTLLEHGSKGRGYLLKERLKDSGELNRSVREVAAGGAIVDPQIVDELLTMQARKQGSVLERLTPREREILALVAEGRSNSAIADNLAITKRGVERHINSIFGKLELGDSDEISRREARWRTCAAVKRHPDRTMAAAQEAGTRDEQPDSQLASLAS